MDRGEGGQNPDFCGRHKWMALTCSGSTSNPNYTNYYVLLNLYYTLIFPYLSYCNIVWGSNYPSYLLPLVILQKRIIRIVCNLPYLVSTKTCFFNLNILILDNINNYQVPLFMFRLHNNQYPRPDSFPLTTGSQIHSHFTRSAHHLRPQFARIQVKQFSIMCNGPLL